MEISIKIHETGKIPKWYGVAYYVSGYDAVVCYPIPLNHIVSWARSLYNYAKIAKNCHWIDGQTLWAYGKGFSHGKESINKKLVDAYESGYRDAELDRRGEDVNNKRSNCSTCIHNPHSSANKPIRPKKASSK